MLHPLLLSHVWKPFIAARVFKPKSPSRELARAAGVSSSAVSQHTTALRDAGLISSHRDATNVLHTMTPLGASLLRGSGADRDVTPPVAPAQPQPQAPS
ncbi:ArsR/SmtB family transcription factor [Streptomyces sp. NBC_01537]|uniref:ArsR/SmtB family transcription factor n=1 Tax=Streptomyces sp. NBC_01537 TaxID=2903896 RepID=UPI003863D821